MRTGIAVVGAEEEDDSACFHPKTAEARPSSIKKDLELVVEVLLRKKRRTL